MRVRVGGLAALAFDGDGGAEGVKDVAAYVGVEGGGWGVECDGGHAAADVAADGVWVEELCGCEGDADADVVREVDVGHDGDVADVVGAGETVE